MAYSQVEWNTGDVITAAKLNNMDDGISANDNALNKIGAMTVEPGKTVNVSGGSNRVNTFNLEEGVYIICETVILNKALQSFSVAHALNNADAPLATLYHTGASTNFGSINTSFVVSVNTGGGSVDTSVNLPGDASATSASYFGSATKIK